MKNHDDNDELNNLLSKSPVQPIKAPRSLKNIDEPISTESETDKFTTSAIQWSTSNGKVFIPTGSTVRTLSPAVYEMGLHNELGIYFEKIPVKTEGIIDFPEATTHKVLEEIQKFWDRENIFRDFELTYKRGIILWGPPGGGKSSTLQLVSRDVISRGGVVLKFENPLVFSSGLRKFREIQPDTPIVVLMEDIDSTILHYNETDVINILDGVDKMDKIIFLATTNYPEKLGDRIMNRPSRFDKRFRVGYPNEKSRELYFKYLIGKRKAIEHTVGGVIKTEIDVPKWVKETKDFSIAHLKELFVAVVILGDEYDHALKTLTSMKTQITSEDDGDFKIGFKQNG